MFFCYCYGDHRDIYVRTHSCQHRRGSDRGGVRGKLVLDFAAGSGLQGIAAALAGAASVEAVDIDSFACAACRFNAAANGVAITVTEADIVGSANVGWDVVLAGDVCYERPAAERITAWLRRLAGPGASGGCLVLLGDPGRTYLPRQGLERLIAYGVKTSRELEERSEE